ncbi:MAG: hypothetical protein PF489_07875 [Salinivirgaceae bacterium]|jgi:hypothetical protein|nr:hypothetical protein [Salinivirgaceae bacterium]
MKKYSFLNTMRMSLVALSALLLTSSCGDEFDLFNDELVITSDYEEVVVLYANMDLTKDINLIRVNRAFAATGFADVNYIQDSIQFAPGDIEVYFHKIYKGDTTSYLCYDTVVEKEESEFFNTGEVIMYAFRSQRLLENDVDDLEYIVSVRKPNGEITEAATLPVGNFTFNRPSAVWDEFGFGTETFEVSINAPRNSQAYQISGEVGYREITYIDGDYDTVFHEFTISIGRSTVGNPQASDIISFETGSKAFYYKVASHVRTYGDTVNAVSRKFTGVRFTALCGNPDLALAIASGSTSTGFHDNTTTFSNVNNGIGYVSAYNRKVTRKLTVSNQTVEYLEDHYPQFRFVRN